MCEYSLAWSYPMKPRFSLISLETVRRKCFVISTTKPFAYIQFHLGRLHYTNIGSIAYSSISIDAETFLANEIHNSFVAASHHQIPDVVIENHGESDDAQQPSLLLLLQVVTYGRLFTFIQSQYIKPSQRNWHQATLTNTQPRTIPSIRKSI